MKIKINHGCGSVRPKGWINTDSSLNALVQKNPLFGRLVSRIFRTVNYNHHDVVYVNLNRNWSYKSEMIDLVYASHLFEHLDKKAVDLFLQESFRVLKHSGTIRLVVPDLYQIAKKYVVEFEMNEKTDPSVDFMWAINMHREGQYKTGWNLKNLLAWIQGYPHQHKFMYDSKSIQLLLEKYGFQSIRFCSYGKSEYINEIQDVEGTKESYLSVYIEAKKA
jgi:predicted SAM-dependent methyltransferase